MKIVVNIILLLVLLVLLAAAVTVPGKWVDANSPVETPEKSEGGQQSALASSPETSESKPADDPAETDSEVEGSLTVSENTRQETAPESDGEKKDDEDSSGKIEPAPPEVTAADILAIISKLQRGESGEAAVLVNEALDSLSDRDAVALQTIVSTSAARNEEIESLSNQLSETRAELTKVHRAAKEELQKSINVLATATESAKKAAADAEKRANDLEKTRKELAKAPPSRPAPKKKIKLPENDLVDFAFGSTYLSEANKETLTKVAGQLKKEDGIVVQLRGHTDTIGDPEYNAILANARCEMARDFLIEQGIDTSRISIVSFGESQVFKNGVVVEKPRRVEIIFRHKP